MLVNSNVPEANPVLVNSNVPEANPDLAAEMKDECCRLLGRLGDKTLRSVAIWKMEGYTNAEIARKLGCVEQTVERKLQRIRRQWEREEIGR
jgi:DNA-directed RNA polymerase specialized sigma24 family protein